MLLTSRRRSGCHGWRRSNGSSACLNQNVVKTRCYVVEISGSEVIRTKHWLGTLCIILITSRSTSMTNRGGGSGYVLQHHSIDIVCYTHRDDTNALDKCTALYPAIFWNWSNTIFCMVSDISVGFCSTAGLGFPSVKTITMALLCLSTLLP